MLLHDSSKSIKDECFTRFMSSDDERDTFTKSVLSELENFAGMLPVQMQDSIGNKFGVEIFHVPLNPFDEHIGYLVGIREQSQDTLGDLVSGREDTVDRIVAGVSERIDAIRTGNSVPSDSGKSMTSSQGTPHESVWNDLPGSPCEGGAPCPTRQQLLMFPEFAETKRNGRDVSLVSTMMSWNITVVRPFCCPLHASLDEVRHSCKRLRARACFSRFGKANWQCRLCGILGDADDFEADICEHCDDITGPKNSQSI